MACNDEQVYSDICWCYQLKGEIAQKQGKLDEAFGYYTSFREKAEDGCKKHDSITAVIYVLFANMTLAVLKTGLSEKETGKNYAIQAISALLDFYKIVPSQEMLLDAAEKMLEIHRFDLLHVTTTLKEFFGEQLGAMDETEIRILKNAFHSFSDYVDKSKG